MTEAAGSTSTAKPSAMSVDDRPLRAWGAVAPDELERIVVVSPHLDDAVLGCGLLLLAHPGAKVVTVYTRPLDTYPDPPTRWDEMAGFHPGEDVLMARRAEDTRALAAVGATPVWLDYYEHQYLPREDWITADQIVDELETVLRDARPTAVFAPFGIANPDHVEVHRAARMVRDRFPEPSWFCYEDYGYKHIPGLLARRLAELFNDDIWPTPACPPVSLDLDAKRAAFELYASQVLALEADWAIGSKLDAPAPEQYWRLEPPPGGWGAVLAAS